MVLKTGMMMEDTYSICSGCHKPIHMNGYYVALELDGSDKSLQCDDSVYAYFHNQHCISLSLKKAEE